MRMTIGSDAKSNEYKLLSYYSPYNSEISASLLRKKRNNKNTLLLITILTEKHRLKASIPSVYNYSPKLCQHQKCYSLSTNDTRHSISEWNKRASV